MSGLINPHKNIEKAEKNKNIEKAEKNSQFSEGGVFVREDDQDWGSSGMNNVQTDLE